MKVFFYVGYPLAWAKGGHAFQINETKRALIDQGVDVGWLHNEDDTPPAADILHYFTRPPGDFHWQLAKRRGMKIVLSECLQASVIRPHWTWPLRGQLGKVLPRVMGRGLYGTLGLGVYRNLDAAIAVTPAEVEYMKMVMGTQPERTHLIGNGVEEVFFDASIKPIPFDGLLYSAYVCERKNSIAVARLAKRARVPVKFIAPALFPDSDYAKAFAREVDNEFVLWEPDVADRRHLAAIYRGACGSFLASQNESLPLALLESLAAGTPVMAPDLPNLRGYFGDAVAYVPAPDRPEAATALQQFYAACRKGLKQSFAVSNWEDIARQIIAVYQSLLAERTP